MHWQLRRSTSKCPQLWRPRLHIIRWRAAAREHHIKINYWYIITTLVHLLRICAAQGYHSCWELSPNLVSCLFSRTVHASTSACVKYYMYGIIYWCGGVSVLLLLLYGTCFNQYVVVVVVVLVVYLTACGVHKNIIISMHAWDRGRAWIRTTSKVTILLLGLINNWYRSNNQLGEGLCEVSAILLCVVWWISLSIVCCLDNRMSACTVLILVEQGPCWLYVARPPLVLSRYTNCRDGMVVAVIVSSLT